jgi:hypothetical protein
VLEQQQAQQRFDLRMRAVSLQFLPAGRRFAVPGFVNAGDVGIQTAFLTARQLAYSSATIKRAADTTPAAV